MMDPIDKIAEHFNEHFLVISDLIEQELGLVG